MRGLVHPLRHHGVSTRAGTATDVTVVEELLVVVARPPPVAAPGTTHPAKMTDATGIGITTVTVTVTTIGNVVTLVTVRAAQMLGRSPLPSCPGSVECMLTLQTSERDVKDEREDRDRRDNGTNGDDRKGKTLLGLCVDVYANCIVALDSPPPQHDDLDVAE
ncbi:hypothetical protein SLS62_004048 [Diatrype stigma]|uniref:Uncharacterized protein n=1 Tax=Diatrype stigma TaxID=117547 RepID=A0AAN9YU11_9PEZI